MDQWQNGPAQQPGGNWTGEFESANSLTTTQQTDLQQELQEHSRAASSGGKWFYWIAGLSIVNTIITVFGGTIAFVVGLGVTRIADGAIAQFGQSAAAVAIPITFVVVGVYVAIGYYSCQRAKWAFITGLVLYALDGMLLLMMFDVFSVAFHGYALWCIYRGMQAADAAARTEWQLQQMGTQKAA